MKQDRDEISEEVLCAEYAAVYRYAVSFCRNETDAEDITQETFLKAMRGGSSFKGESSLYTYLCAIAKNLWINRCKRLAREQVTDSLPEPQGEEGAEVEKIVWEKEASFAIHQILHQLDEPYKEVFSLRVFGQLSFAEIAKLFGRTEGWARVTYHRAKNAIGEELRKDGYDGK